MKEKFLLIKQLFAGKWNGEGYAKFPTITNTAYKEELEFIADKYKDAVHFNQKTVYLNETENNGQTVFWDTGFIILKNDTIVLNSTQVGGRFESYLLTDSGEDFFSFESVTVLNDAITIRSQRIFSINKNNMHYKLNMATKQATFQNHLAADLKKINI